MSCRPKVSRNNLMNILKYRAINQNFTPHCTMTPLSEMYWAVHGVVSILILIPFQSDNSSLYVRGIKVTVRQVDGMEYVALFSVDLNYSLMNCDPNNTNNWTDQTKLQSGTVSLCALPFSLYYVEKWTTQLW